jgi:nitroreductase/NAD-dependent dihydropyrimidine dehydrogenase PreA subunit
MELINFSVDQEQCIGCESCVADCPLLILTMDGDTPTVVPGRASRCIRCLHCLTVCPAGAVSINGFTPEDCLEMEDMLPGADQMEALIRGRRSVRSYQDESIEPAVLERLLQVAWQAPTGVNARGVLFTVVDDRDVMNRLREAVMDRLAELVRSDSLPENLGFFAGFVKLWQEKEIDTLFKGAPHLIITSAPKDCPCPEQDCIIALSYFELFAHSLGLGTVWDGLAKRAIVDLMPDLAAKLGVPADHHLGYVMAFGKPAVEYHRTVPLRPAAINRVFFP